MADFWSGEFETELKRLTGKKVVDARVIDDGLGFEIVFEDGTRLVAGGHEFDAWIERGGRRGEEGGV